MTNKATKRDKLLIASRSKPSPEWARLEKRYKSNFNECAACGKKRSLIAHHIKPVFLFPSLELEVSNLITLCTGESNCHLTWGHLGDFKSCNPTVVADTAWYRERVRTRRKWGK